MNMATNVNNITQAEINAAYKYCENFTACHTENFPVVSLFLPNPQKKYLCAIYTFLRIADDIGDNTLLTKTERLVALHDWKKQLEHCYYNEKLTTNPIFIALKDVIQQCKIPITMLLALLKAFEQDIHGHDYKKYTELLDYANYSANPIGRILLMLFNYHGEKFFTLADSISTGLQLTDFWQDLAVDITNNRIYIPDAVLEQFHYSKEQLLTNYYNAAFKSMMAHLVALTEQKFTEGEALCDLVSNKKLAVHIRLVIYGGQAVLTKIKQMDYNLFAGPPSLSLIDKLLILKKALFKQKL